MVDIVVDRGMVDHVEMWDEGILLCVSKGSVIGEEITPLIIWFELGVLYIGFVDDVLYILWGDCFEEMLAKLLHVIVLCYVVY